MQALRPALLILTMALASSAAAESFDGSMPLTCTAEKGHDCLPTETSCSQLKATTDIAPVFDINFADKKIRSPFRTAILPVQSTSTNADSLILQGASLLMAWNALIDKKTGALTVSISDSKGAYVAFGQCRVKPTPKS